MDTSLSDDTHYFWGKGYDGRVARQSVKLCITHFPPNQMKHRTFRRIAHFLCKMFPCLMAWKYLSLWKRDEKGRVKMEVLYNLALDEKH